MFVKTSDLLAKILVTLFVISFYSCSVKSGTTLDYVCLFSLFTGVTATDVSIYFICYIPLRDMLSWVLPRVNVAAMIKTNTIVYFI